MIERCGLIEFTIKLEGKFHACGTGHYYTINNIPKSTNTTAR
jgi:hypothetical protein